MSLPRDRERDLARLADAFFSALCIDHTEYGGIGVDPKRPFGNSDVNGDILEIIGWRPELGDTYTGEQIDYAYALYHVHLIPYLRECWTLLSQGWNPLD